MFSGRSDKYGKEQPESVYFLDKFMQPTHMYVHSNPLDYGKSASEGGSWD